ncbi:hypothetical protein B0H16DRAFT_1644290 [Mycena metata]|uniref:Uncharacterized protein n=1 Tax=Mycena metata TaxID=1033252 RepID=A0AAD7GQ35_9AGAR|nr:hypothetical protein B0H16DRAFT_1644290 [Mycena metata]
MMGTPRSRSGNRISKHIRMRQALSDILAEYRYPHRQSSQHPPNLRHSKRQWHTCRAIPRCFSTFIRIHLSLLCILLRPLPHNFGYKISPASVLPLRLSQEAGLYCRSRFSEYPPRYKLWIRPSTGLVSADFTVTKDRVERPMIFGRRAVQSPLFVFGALDLEGMTINCMTLEEYHRTCEGMRHYERHRIVSSSPVNIGAVISLSMHRQYGDFPQIAYLDREVALQLDPFPRGVVTKNGWTRYSFSSLELDYETAEICFIAYCDASIWLSQANYIFNSLHINNREDYALVSLVEFTIEIQSIIEGPPMGYLFVCPASHFQMGPVSVKWPDYPAYWSSDPSGLERLCPHEATRQGFPSLKMTTHVVASSWDTSIYAGLRQFHTGKGFDPDSQDVARHLGYPLFKIFNHAKAYAADGAEDTEATLESPPSRAFRFLINLQLALISFLALCWVNERMS